MKGVCRVGKKNQGENKNKIQSLKKDGKKTKKKLIQRSTPKNTMVINRGSSPRWNVNLKIYTLEKKFPFLYAREVPLLWDFIMLRSLHPCKYFSKRTSPIHDTK